MRIAALLAAAVAAVGCGADAAAPTDEPPHSIAEPWSPVPFAIDASLLADAQRACREIQPPQGVSLAAVDARGGSRLLLVYASPTSEAECSLKVTPDGHAVADGGSTTIGSEFRRPPGGSVEPQGQSGQDDGVETISSLAGQAGPAVARVEITTSTGRVVRASLGPNGWFAAWWPGSDIVTQVTGYDALGSVTGTSR
jgi:hypothetical protein